MTGNADSAAAARAPSLGEGLGGLTLPVAAAMSAVENWPYVPTAGHASEAAVADVPARAYVATGDEAEKVAEVRRYRQRVPPTRFRRKESGELVLEVTHADMTAGAPDLGGLSLAEVSLMAAFGTKEMAFFEGLTGHLATVGLNANKDGGGEVLDYLLATVKGIEPKDHVEAMLAAQMAATHLATMGMAARLLSATTLESRDSAERTFNKLARTYVAQAEALKRYRTGGEQKVTVQHQHVTVNEGGQAVVGNVSHGGGGRRKNER